MVIMEDAVHQILADLVALPPIEGALVVTRRGRILAAITPGGTDTKALARECRTLLDLGSDAVSSDSEDLVRVDLRAEKGSTVLLPAGKDAILAVLTSTRTPESLNLELTRAATAIGEAVR